MVVWFYGLRSNVLSLGNRIRRATDIGNSVVDQGVFVMLVLCSVIEFFLLPPLQVLVLLDKMEGKVVPGML